jgi:hypothetical protein
MRFEIADADPWHPDVISRHLRYLDANNTTITDEDVESILFCYLQPPTIRNRFFHGPNHGGFVGQAYVPEKLREVLSERFTPEQAGATLAIAGLFHDAAYKHVDVLEDGSRVWADVLQRRIGPYARYTTAIEGGKTIFRTLLTEKGRNDPVTQMVAQMFEVGPEGIVHTQAHGGNEFDSALAAAHFLKERGVPAKYIVAVTAAIAATVPFRPALVHDEAGNVTDGYMNDLAHRVHAPQLRLSQNTYQPDWQDTNDIMLLAVHLANRDTSPFFQQGNVAGLIRGGRDVKREESPDLRQRGPSTIRRLARAAGLMRSAPFLYAGLGGGKVPVPAAHAAHVYIPRDNDGNIRGVDYAYPPLPVYQTAVAYTERNAKLALSFFQAHEAAIVTVASIATLLGEPGAPVPGIVSAEVWSPTALPHGNAVQRLSADDKLIYNELMYGKSQIDVDVVTPHRSPIGGLIFGAIGGAGTERLSRVIQDIRAATQDPDPFSNPETARAFLQSLISHIGHKNFTTIIEQLQRVSRSFEDDPALRSPGRVAKLGALSLGLTQ